MFQTKIVEQIKTHILYTVTPPPPENHAIYGIMWKSILEPGRPDETIWRMRISCWVTKATTHTQNM